MRRLRVYLLLGYTHFWKQVAKALTNPIFVVLTLFGNLALLLCATAFYFVERGINPQVNSYIDCVWWAFVTMTTVGYGDVVPSTGMGRIVSIALMMTGGVLFLSFIALLSSAFTELEFLELRLEIQKLQKALVDTNKILSEDDS